jgi:hypothetical protein
LKFICSLNSYRNKIYKANSFRKKEEDYRLQNAMHNITYSYRNPAKGHAGVEVHVSRQSPRCRKMNFVLCFTFHIWEVGGPRSNPNLRGLIFTALPSKLKGKEDRREQGWKKKEEGKKMN